MRNNYKTKYFFERKVINEAFLLKIVMKINIFDHRMDKFWCLNKVNILNFCFESAVPRISNLRQQIRNIFRISNGNDIERKQNYASIIGLFSVSKRNEPTYSRTW